MKYVVIQCSGSKTLNSCYKFDDSIKYNFQANENLTSNFLIPWEISSLINDDWISYFRTLSNNVNEDDKDRFKKDHNLIKAIDLYSNSVYEEIKNRVGYKSCYILSAGWGLVRGDTLIPRYDITFSSKGSKEAKISPLNRAKHKSMIDTIENKPGDELHLFLTVEYLKYWNLYFNNIGFEEEKVFLHWYNENGGSPQKGRYTVKYHNNVKKGTNWQYSAAKDYLRSINEND